MSYPDFLGIGAQKAGTTWLHRNLQLHPDIWLPPEKELHYFDEKRGRRQSWRARLFGHGTEDIRWRRHLRRRTRTLCRDPSLHELRWSLRYLVGRTDDAWYASLFKAGAGKVTGEVTPAYSMLADEEVAEIAALMPDAKIVFLMRNPIERSWSHAMMDSRIVDAAIGSDREALRAHLAGEGSRLRTDYARTLDVWSAHFAPERIFVGFMEDVALDPHGLMDRIWSFLGVEPLPPEDLLARPIHEGGARGIPSDTAVELAGLYRELVEELDRRFGGHAAWWRFCVERLLAEPPEEPYVATPLRQGPLWSAWAALDPANAEPPLQSAALSRLAVASPR